MPSILIVDDEKAIRKTLAEILSYEGYKIDEAADGEEGLKKFNANQFDVVLCDIKMPKMDGLEFLEKARQVNEDIPIIMISGHGNIETAVEAVKKGAYDFISKPPDLNRMLITLRNALDRQTLAKETKVLKRKVTKVQEMVGNSLPIQKIKDTIDKVAPTDARVLVTGDNGVGKELVARWIHEKSNRSSAPIVEVNCAAIPSELIESELFGHEKGAFSGAIGEKKGMFQIADGGTIFLDEIGDITPKMQVSLLRAIQEKKIQRVGGTKEIPVDVRVIAATNKDLEELCEREVFRWDLFFRLAVTTLKLPALRDWTKKEIKDLIEHFNANYFLDFPNRQQKLKFSKEAIDKLTSYHFKGNIRELQNLIISLYTFCDNEVSISDLPERITKEKKHPQSYNENEKAHILKVLTDKKWNITLSSETLGIARETLYRRIKDYELKNPNKK